MKKKSYVTRAKKSCYYLKYKKLDKLVEKPIWTVDDMRFIDNAFYQLICDVENKMKAREVEGTYTFKFPQYFKK